MTKQDNILSFGNSSHTDNLIHIAFSGKMGSGKDTAAAILRQIDLEESQSLHVKPYIIEKFARPIQDFVYALSCYELLPPYQMDQGIHLLLEEFVSSFSPLPKPSFSSLLEIIKRTRVEPGVKNRERIRAIAEYCREVFPSIWIDILYRKWIRSLQDGSKTLITDLRFKEEAAWCEQAGIYRIRIDVDPTIQYNRLLSNGEQISQEDLDHISENDLDDYPRFTYRFSNNGSINDLKLSLQFMYKKLKSLRSFSREESL